MDVQIRHDKNDCYIVGCPDQMEWRARAELVDQFRTFVGAGNCNGVIVDLGGVTFINSAGLGGIFGLRKYLQSINAVMVVARPNPSLARLLETINLPKLVPVVETLDEARAAIPANSSNTTA